MVREGRITRAQLQALDELWPQFGIEYENRVLDLSVIFNTTAPVTMEIGFGNGDALCHIAQQHDHENFIGIEVHRPGVGRLLKNAHKAQLTNLKVICHDAIDVLENMVSNDSLNRINIYFPDPWPKKRHHKRRLIRPSFLSLVARRLKSSGILHLATDWQPYAEHMFETLTQHEAFYTHTDAQQLEDVAMPRPDYRPLTKFEQRGQRKGHGVWDLIYVRN